MSHSIVKQAIPIELLEQIRSNEKLQILIKEIWSYGSGMFLWFNALPTSDPDYFREPTIDVFIQDYEEDYEAFNGSEDKRLFPFTPRTTFGTI